MEAPVAHRRSLSQVGPLPYKKAPGDDRECSNCGLITSADSAYCANCGDHLGSAGGYQERDGDNVLCHVCENYNQETAVFCRSCGHAIPPQASKELKVAQWSTPQMTVSSSGRDDT